MASDQTNGWHDAYACWLPSAIAEGHTQVNDAFRAGFLAAVEQFSEDMVMWERAYTEPGMPNSPVPPPAREVNPGLRLLPVRSAPPAKQTIDIIIRDVAEIERDPLPDQPEDEMRVTVEELRAKDTTDVVSKDPDFATWSGASNTFAAIRVWDEAAWDYHDVVDGPVVGRNAEADYRAMHSLLRIVLRIRYV